MRTPTEAEKDANKAAARAVSILMDEILMLHKELLLIGECPAKTREFVRESFLALHDNLNGRLSDLKENV